VPLIVAVPVSVRNDADVIDDPGAKKSTQGPKSL
jgi:hypothetical protein